MTTAPDKVCVGMITKPHGIKGHVCVHSYCETPEDIFTYQPLTNKTGDVQFKLVSVGTVRGLFVASVNGITDRNLAETLAKTELYMDRDLLPEVEGDDTFYVSDLIGLTIISETGESLGQVMAVENFGAGDILECKSDVYRTFMVPFTDDAVISVDMDTAQIVISAMAESFIRPSKENE